MFGGLWGDIRSPIKSSELEKDGMDGCGVGGMGGVVVVGVMVRLLRINLFCDCCCMLLLLCTVVDVVWKLLSSVGLVGCCVGDDDVCV